MLIEISFDQINICCSYMEKIQRFYKSFVRVLKFYTRIEQNFWNKKSLKLHFCTFTIDKLTFFEAIFIIKMNSSKTVEMY